MVDDYIDNSKKVVFLNASDREGGAAIAAYRLFKGIGNKGWNTKFYCIKKSTDDMSVLEIPKCSNNSGENSYYTATKQKINYIFSSAIKGSDKKLFEEIKIFDPDIIHLHWIVGGLLTIEMIGELRTLCKPIIWTMHDMWPFTGGCHYNWTFTKEYKFCNYYRSECRNCPYLIDSGINDTSNNNFQRKKKTFFFLNLNLVSPSTWLAKEAKKSYLFKNRVIDIIPNGFNVDVLCPRNKNDSRQLLGLSNTKYLILCGAEYNTDIKGYFLLEEIMDALLFSENEVDFVFYGNSIVLKKYKYNVYDVGRIEPKDEKKLSVLYSACDLFLIPSICDNLPNTAIESLLCGTPVVSFKIGGLVDIIEHKENGYVADKFNVEDIAFGIDFVLRNLNETKKRKIIRKRAIAKYNLEKIASEYEILYNRAIVTYKNEQKIKQGGKRDIKNNKKKRKKDKPIVSIITVTKDLVNNNRVNKFNKMIESIANQDYGRDNIEHIIIDGGSTDGSVDLIKYFDKLGKIDFWISETDSGIYEAMNRGITYSSGRYIAFMNTDDYYLSYAVSESIMNIQKNNIDLSYAGFLYENEINVVTKADEPRDWDASMLIQGIPGGHETVFAHRDCFKIVGLFDTKYKIVADYDWIIRAFLKGLRAKKLCKNILIMSLGGASFEKKIEYNENIELLTTYFPNIDKDCYEILYKLKYYNNWDKIEIDNFGLVKLLKKSNDFDRLYHDSLSISINNLLQKPCGKINPAERTNLNSKKIAIVVSILMNASGGAERIAIQEANELCKRGHDVTIVCCHGLAGEPFYKVDIKIPVIDLAISPYKEQYYDYGRTYNLDYDYLKGRQYEKLNYDPNEKDFGEWNKKNIWKVRIYRGFFRYHDDFDVIISHMPSTYPYVLLASFDNAAFNIVRLHNSPYYKFFSPLYPADGKFDRYMRLLTLEKADLITVLFEQYKYQLPTIYRSRAITIPNFTEFDNFTNVAKEEKTEKVILSVGRLSDQKNQSALIKAFVAIKKKYPEWKLNIYGDGPLKEKLTELCLSIDLDPSKILKGTTKNISKIYDRAEIFVLPSLFEGFPLTLIEAMAYELPVIGYDECEGVKYIIKNRINGLLIESNDKIESLSNALNCLIENSDLRLEFGINAKKYVRDHYSLKTSVDKLEQIVVKRSSNDKINPTYVTRTNINNLRLEKICEIDKSDKHYHAKFTKQIDIDKIIRNSITQLDRNQLIMIKIIRQSGLFLPIYYVNKNRLNSKEKIDPLVHFIFNGWKEGFFPNPLFDTIWYINRYPEVKETCYNPLYHYIIWGADKGYDPHPDFSTKAYKAANPDVEDTGMNPLAHYLNIGAREGRPLR